LENKTPLCIVPHFGMDESSGRSATPVGFLRRGSGISLRNQSNEDRPSQYNNKPGKSTNLNPVKARFSENKEKPRYLHGTFHSSGSKASSVSSSKAPVRKYHNERQKRPFLAEADVAESSSRRTEARRLQSGKKAVGCEDGHSYTQKSTSEGSSSSTFTEGGLPEEHGLGVSGSSAHTVDSGNTALSAMEPRQNDREELHSGRPQGASTFSHRRTVPQSLTTGVKLSSSPGTNSTALQRRGLKSLGCTSISDVLPSGCSSSDSIHNRRVEVTKKRTSDAGSSSRSRGISEQSNLALEEHIGSVSTALTEEQFAKCINQSVYKARNSDRDVNKIAVDDVKCSICQEEYVEGEGIGRMQCEHQYHVCCIHQWLKQKNWCPICKASAMPSEVDKRMNLG
ncbi:hypothetical protein BAE44_0008201, partial [Dichanthelium oligosanthes]